MKGPADGLSALYPPGIEDMPVAWRQVRIPGPPPGLTLSATEREHPVPAVRYARRTIQTLTAGDERLALVDKASPHALHDLMISGLASPPHPGPGDVSPALGRALWRTASSFVRFAAQSGVREEFGLAGGRMHLALNCDPNTLDRESCQANKQFHLHLLYWTRSELKGLERPERVADLADPRLRRQILDPLAFPGARLIRECLADLPPGSLGAALLPWREAEAIAGHAPLGCLMRLPGWDLLDDPAFEALVRNIHGRITAAAFGVLAAFTGQREPPPPWERHQLLPPRAIQANLARLPWSDQVRSSLGLLALRLQDLPPALATRLKQGPAPSRLHHMSLNQPCYSLNLCAPEPSLTEGTRNATSEVLLILQTKLFSGIGGAGLLSLAGIPSVRILRGQGTFSSELWHHRARFQRDFAFYNRHRLADAPGIELGPVRRFADTESGWVNEKSDPSGHPRTRPY